MNVAQRSLDIHALIGSLPALVPLVGCWWERALAAATIIRMADGDELAMGARGLDHFTLMLRGALKIRLQSEDGRSFSLYKVYAGEMCALSLACLQGKRIIVADVLAEGDVIALRIPKAHLDNLLAHSPQFRQFMMSCMARCYGRLLEVVEEVAFDHLSERIERELRERYRDGGSPVLRITHQELADDVGSTREVISRLLKQMEGQGQFRLGRGSITLPHAFEGAANPSDRSRCKNVLPNRCRSGVDR